MKILTKKEQTDIAKRLAAIYYIAVNWKDEEWSDFVTHIVGNCAEIAYTIGGERMMSIDVPALVERLNRRDD